MKREYKIAYYAKENERAIKKEKKVWEGEDDKEVRWLSRDGNERVRTYKEERAKRFFHEDAAISTLVIIKRRWDIRNQEPYRPEPEKQSWSEL